MGVSGIRINSKWVANWKVITIRTPLPNQNSRNLRKDERRDLYFNLESPLYSSIHSLFVFSSSPKAGDLIPHTMSSFMGTGQEQTRRIYKVSTHYCLYLAIHVTIPSVCLSLVLVSPCVSSLDALMIPRCVLVECRSYPPSDVHGLGLYVRPKAVFHRRWRCSMMII